MTFRYRTLLAAAAGVLALAAPAEAQAPTKFRLTLGYDGKLLIKVLDVNVTQTADDNGFSTQVRLRSYGVLEAFKKIRQTASGSGRIDGGVARPGVFTQQNIDGERNRKVRVTWTGSDVVTAATPSYGNMGFPPATRAQKLEAVDPITALMRFTLMDRPAQACAGSMKFFDGKRRYDLVFSNRAVRAPNAREQRLGLTSPVTCSVTYRELAGFKRKKPGDKPGQGLKNLRMAFARHGQGGPWVISSITGGTPLGDATIELARLSTSGETPEN